MGRLIIREIIHTRGGNAVTTQSGCLFILPWFSFHQYTKATVIACTINVGILMYIGLYNATQLIVIDF